MNTQTKKAETLYIVSLPFPGWIHSTMQNGVVAYTGDKTFSEYCAEKAAQNEPGPYYAVTGKTLESLWAAHEESQKTDLTPITQDRFFDMLNVLPPCRWTNANGIEAFHVSERLTGNLVSWFLCVGNDYFECVQGVTIKRAELNEMVAAYYARKKAAPNAEPDFKTIPDCDVFHIWRDGSNGAETSIPPTYYADNGTPAGEDGEDMIYLRTEIRSND